ncbi:MAG TPA: MarR family winged helix-turn-helix transcriptional regulator [Pseudonocardiaceae bacterium]
MARSTDSTQPGAPRGRLIAALDLAGREVSTSTIMFHSTLATRRGLSAIETKALDILLRRGPMTHARLCEETALAPASVTELVDRLHHKGYADRLPHPTDRRRILIVANADRANADIAPLFGPWQQQLHTLYDAYTDQELTVIADFLAKAAVLQRDAAEALIPQP